VEISVNASEEIETERVKDLETLRRHASDLRRKADAATQTYDRTAWNQIRRNLRSDPIRGVAFAASTWNLGVTTLQARSSWLTLVMYAMDLAAVAKRDTIQRLSGRSGI
jgi:hypothetical protein